jgi:hypothetical protein
MTQSEIDELIRIKHNLSSFPEFKTTTTKNVAKELLLSNPIFCRGDFRKAKAKHIGLGVYEVSSCEL